MGLDFDNSLTDSRFKTVALEIISTLLVLS